MGSNKNRNVSADLENSVLAWAMGCFCSFCLLYPDFCLLYSSLRLFIDFEGRRINNDLPVTAGVKQESCKTYRTLKITER
jgi:hypothetical protein